MQIFLDLFPKVQFLIWAHLLSHSTIPVWWRKTVHFVLLHDPNTTQFSLPSPSPFQIKTHQESSDLWSISDGVSSASSTGELSFQPWPVCCDIQANYNEKESGKDGIRPPVGASQRLCRFPKFGILALTISVLFNTLSVSFIHYLQFINCNFFTFVVMGVIHNGATEIVL